MDDKPWSFYRGVSDKAESVGISWEAMEVQEDAEVRIAHRGGAVLSRESRKTRVDTSLHV